MRRTMSTGTGSNRSGAAGSVAAAATTAAPAEEEELEEAELEDAQPAGAFPNRPIANSSEALQRALALLRWVKQTDPTQLARMGMTRQKMQAALDSGLATKAAKKSKKKFDQKT